MAYRLNRRSLAALVLGLGAMMTSGCGISTEGSRYLMQHGVSDSGYPPQGAGQNPGSPSNSAMGGEVTAKGIEGERMKAPKQNIPSNVVSTPRT
jgi:hypothetical protein